MYMFSPCVAVPLGWGVYQYEYEYGIENISRLGYEWDSEKNVHRINKDQPNHIPCIPSDTIQYLHTVRSGSRKSGVDARNHTFYFSSPSHLEEVHLLFSSTSYAPSHPAPLSQILDIVWRTQKDGDTLPDALIRPLG
jgi:hypothetical protein